jgi:hypothetical protein
MATFPAEHPSMMRDNKTTGNAAERARRAKLAALPARLKASTGRRPTLSPSLPSNGAVIS